MISAYRSFTRRQDSQERHGFPRNIPGRCCKRTNAFHLDRYCTSYVQILFRLLSLLSEVFAIAIIAGGFGDRCIFFNADLKLPQSHRGWLGGVYPARQLGKGTSRPPLPLRGMPDEVPAPGPHTEAIVLRFMGKATEGAKKALGDYRSNCRHVFKGITLPIPWRGWMVGARLLRPTIAMRSASTRGWRCSIIEGVSDCWAPTIGHVVLGRLRAWAAFQRRRSGPGLARPG
jgi:hypothetical protein